MGTRAHFLLRAAAVAVLVAEAVYPRTTPAVRPAPDAAVVAPPPPPPAIVAVR